jgi:hypothetical protein
MNTWQGVTAAALSIVALAACRSDEPPASVATTPCSPLDDATVTGTSEGILADGKRVVVVYYPYRDSDHYTPRRVFFGTPDRLAEGRIADPEPACPACAPCVTFDLAGKEYSAVFGGKACSGMIRPALYEGNTAQTMTLVDDGYARGAATASTLSFVCF